jgi:hypothetical protein
LLKCSVTDLLFPHTIQYKEEQLSKEEKGNKGKNGKKWRGAQIRVDGERDPRQTAKGNPVPGYSGEGRMAQRFGCAVIPPLPSPEG